MRALLPVFALALGACDDGPRHELRRTDPPDPLPRACGDGTCAAGETAYSCPRDCWPHEVPIDARGLATCAGSRTREQLGQDIDISLAFADSLIGLGDMLHAYGGFVGAANQTLATLAREVDADATPEGFTHDAATGSYRRSENGGELVVTIKFGRDYEAGKTGEVIKPSFFLSHSYLVGAAVRVDSSSATVESYEKTGPLVELLGLGTTPPATFTIQWEDASREIGKQHSDAAMSWNSSLRGTQTAFTARAAGPLSQTPTIDVAVSDVSVTSDRGASVKITKATLRGSSGAGWLSGRLWATWDLFVEWEVVGATFPHRGTLRYVDPAFEPIARVTLGCP